MRRLTALKLKCIDDIKHRNGVTIGMFGVSNSVRDRLLKEAYDCTPGILINRHGYPFDTTTAG